MIINLVVIFLHGIRKIIIIQKLYLYIGILTLCIEHTGIITMNKIDQNKYYCLLLIVLISKTWWFYTVRLHLEVEGVAHSS